MSVRSTDPLVRRLSVALAGVVSALLLIGASFATWLRLPDGAGGTTTVNGWGGVGGGSQIAGQNLNDAMAGQATFRPGIIPLILGVLVIVAASAIAVAAIGPRPHRVSAAVLIGAGVLALGWGIWRLLDPDSVGLLATGEGGPGWGQWLTLAAGLLAATAGLMVLLGIADPPARVMSRGIQA